jgi:hypothetical protein
VTKGTGRVGGHRDPSRTSRFRSRIIDSKEESNELHHDSSGLHRIWFTGGSSAQDVDKPVPADNEVLIKIHATTVEAADAIFRQGRTPSARLFTGLFTPRFAIPGSEFAGEIEVVGKDVTRFKAGDQVVGSAAPVSARMLRTSVWQKTARWHQNRTA